nr:hypothetical protein GCM10020093_049120 [Planobispora longispora]
MHDPRAVDRGQRGGHADRQRVEAGTAERAARADGLLQVGAGHELGDDVELVAVERRVQHRGGAEPPDPPGGVGLAAEAHPELLVLAVLRIDHLDGDLLLVGGLAEVDGAHAAPAQPAEHSVLSDLGGSPGLRLFTVIPVACAVT